MTATTISMSRGKSRGEEPEWPVWLLVVVMLAIGLLAKTVVVSRSTTFVRGNLSVSYPAAWMALNKQAENELLNVGEPFDSGLFPARFSLLQMPVTSISTNAQSLGDYALKWSDRGAKDLLAYKVLDIEPIKVRGKDAVRVDYVYVADPALATPNSIPVVAHGSDVLVRQGDNMTIARLVAASDAFDGFGQVWDRVLGSLELK
jgi:hypothetical protein